jgi:hypothetical protein
MLKSGFAILMVGLLSAPSMFLQMCGGDDDTPTPSPTPAAGCHSSSDCANGMDCYPTEDSLPCGSCYEPEFQCTTSSDCGDGMVCGLDESRCLCSGPTYVCMSACTADSCGDGKYCSDAGTCEYTQCSTGDYQCPAYTSCTPGASQNGCVRWSCSTDKECGDGSCVNNQCYAALGFCSYPPP